MRKTYERLISNGVREMMQVMPVTFIAGPRQCGKTTLLDIMESQDQERNWVRVSLDSPEWLKAARNDPTGFIRMLRQWPTSDQTHVPAGQLGNIRVSNKGTLGDGNPMIAIDEAQLAPELFRVIKLDVHENQGPGSYLLTGSANPNFMSKVSESLAGRMGIVHMYTLSECELLGREPTFLSKMLSGQVPQASETNVRKHLLDRLVTGGYPFAQQKPPWPIRLNWQEIYIEQIILRDIGEMEGISKLREMLRLLNASMAQTGCLENYSSLARAAKISTKTAIRYLDVFEAWGLLQHLPAWSNSVASGLRKQMKVHYLDTGLVCSRMFLDHEGLSLDQKTFARLTESFVFAELLKQESFLTEGPSLRFSHYRDNRGREIDFVLETPRGDCYAIEVKSGMKPGSRSTDNMKRFKEVAGDKFRMGIILYDGDHAMPFGEDLYTIPIASLWQS